MEDHRDNLLELQQDQIKRGVELLQQQREIIERQHLELAQLRTERKWISHQRWGFALYLLMGVWPFKYLF